MYKLNDAGNSLESSDGKTIPISGIVPESWKTGRDIPESEFDIVTMYSPVNTEQWEYEPPKEKWKSKIVAIPIQQPKEESQQELWEEVIKIIDDSLVIDRVVYDGFIEDMKRTFIIQRINTNK